jgi:hypothetical protein
MLAEGLRALKVQTSVPVLMHPCKPRPQLSLAPLPIYARCTICGLSVNPIRSYLRVPSIYSSSGARQAPPPFVRDHPPLVRPWPYPGCGPFARRPVAIPVSAADDILMTAGLAVIDPPMPEDWSDDALRALARAELQDFGPECARSRAAIGLPDAFGYGRCSRSLNSSAAPSSAS